MEEQTERANPMLHKYLFTVTTFSKLLAMLLFIVLPVLGFYLGIKYQERLIINNSTVSPTQNNKSLDIIPISPSNLDPNSYTAIRNGLTVKISPWHGKVGTIVKIDISGITDMDNLGVNFNDSKGDFSLEGLGIRDNEVRGGKYSGKYTIPFEQRTPPTIDQQNGGPEVPTAKGMGSFTVEHGSDSDRFYTVPFIVDY